MQQKKNIQYDNLKKMYAVEELHNKTYNVRKNICVYVDKKAND